MTATNGNFVVCCGRDVNVADAITTTNGSMLLSAGRDVNLRSTAALTATDGNMTVCSGRDINENAAITLTRGTSIPAQSLGLQTGLVFIAGNSGQGPGVKGGTLKFGPLTPPVTVTGPTAPVVIDYNPTSYTTPTDYLPHFTLTGGATLTEHMLVFPKATKVFDGTTNVTLSGLKGLPPGVTLIAGPNAKANFVNPKVGKNVVIIFSGYTLGGANAAKYALAANCCVAGAKTTGTITAPTPTPTPTPTPRQPTLAPSPSPPPTRPRGTRRRPC